METGAGGWTPLAPARFDARLWRRQARSARALIAAPGSLPLIAPNGQVVTGAVIRCVQHGPRPVASVPYSRPRSQQVGDTCRWGRRWPGTGVDHEPRLLSHALREMSGLPSDGVGTLVRVMARG